MARISTEASPARDNRTLLLELFEAAVAAAAPEAATTRAVDALRLDAKARIRIFAFGKAARPMAGAAAQTLLRSMHTIVGGVLVSPEGGAAPYPTLVSVRGDHPIPGRHSFASATKIAEVASGRRGQDVAVVLISGGTSSLIAAPLRGMSDADLIGLFELLLGSGLDIAAMNAVRKRFSRWSAGRLALALAPATIHCLAISDVAGDDLGVIGSGPCVPDPTTVRDVSAILQRANLLTRIPQTYREHLSAVSNGTIPETPKAAHPAFAHVTARVIGNNHMAVEGVAAAARGMGLTVRIVDTWLGGEAAAAGEAVARELLSVHRDQAGAAADKPTCVVWGGETTVTLSAGANGGSPSGGGRCQELALAAARVLHEAGDAAAGVTILAAGTDGRDGATDAAGAIVGSTTWSAIAGAGRDPAHALTSHESNGALRAAGALIPRRETGTNVNDVVIGVV